jgi:hypothetical protein
MSAITVTTQINQKNVGSGRWSLKSIKSYCAKKDIQLTSAAYVTFDINYGFDYEYLNLNTGVIAHCMNSDPMASMLGL